MSLLIFEDAFSQKDFSEISIDCQKQLTEFIYYAKVKEYENAYEHWLWCFHNCPDTSLKIYTYGLKIVENRYDKANVDDKIIEAALIDSIFRQRILYFPEKLGKIYSDWASSLEKREASKDIVFEKLQLAFETGPTEMSIKNTALYFQQITDKYKNKNPQKVYDVYDDLVEANDLTIDKLSRQLDSLKAKESIGIELSPKERLLKKNNEINLRGLSQIEVILDQIHGGVVDCDRLIFLYQNNFEKNKDDAEWLKKAVSRLLLKECKDNKLYPILVEAWRKADQSIYPKIAILNNSNKEINYNSWKELLQLIEKESDSYKKADYYLKIAYYYRNRNKSTSREYAYKALEVRPSLGEAYLLIANLYARSANRCGDDEFSKRIVYVAAADKARKAKGVDPSVTAKADRSIEAYMKNAPGRWATAQHSTKDSTYHIKCWIGETVIYNPYKK